MKVAVYEGVGKIRLKQRPEIKIEPGEVLVKIKYCGICGTDLHAFQHEGLLEPGLVLGHENVGTVAEIGTGVKGFKVGTRVAVGPPGSCGKCYYCDHGHFAICPTGFSRTNGLGPGHDGGMAQYMRVRDPDTMLHPIPDAVSLEDAVLLDTIAVGLRGMRQSNFKVGDNVVVSGAGAIGLATIQFLKISGARHITVLEPSAFKRALALKMGADEALEPIVEGDGVITKIISRYDGIGADIAFECAGMPQSFQTILAVVRGAGQVLLLGVSGQATPVIAATLIQREIDIKASLAYGKDEIRICLDFLATGRFDTTDLVSDFIGLDDVLEKGFKRLVNSSDLIKIVLAP